MNAQISSGADVCRGSLRFPKLPKRKLFSVMAKWASEDRAAIIARYADAKKDAPDDLLAELKEHDSYASLTVYGFQAVRGSPIRAFDLIAESVGEQAAEALDMTPSEMCDLASEIWDARERAAFLAKTGIWERREDEQRAPLGSNGRATANGSDGIGPSKMERLPAIST